MNNEHAKAYAKLFYGVIVHRAGVDDNSIELGEQTLLEYWKRKIIKFQASMEWRKCVDVTITGTHDFQDVALYSRIHVATWRPISVSNIAIKTDPVSDQLIRDALDYIGRSHLYSDIGWHLAAYLK